MDEKKLKKEKNGEIINEAELEKVTGGSNPFESVEKVGNNNYDEEVAGKV